MGPAFAGVTVLNLVGKGAMQHLFRCNIAAVRCSTAIK
jgi:hypothetical protein